MADGGDFDLSGSLVDTVENELGLTRHGETASAAPDGTPELRMLYQQTQGRGDPHLNELRRLRIVGF